MRIPNHASVVPFRDSRPGHLLVGRFHGADDNFVAIRADDDADPRDRARLVILTPSVTGHDCPYAAVTVDVPVVLDFGDDWYIDVPVDGRHPEAILDLRNGATATPGKLIRSNETFYVGLCCRTEHGVDIHHLLDLRAGRLVIEIPDEDHALVWSSFAVMVRQPDGLPPIELCRWPEAG